MPNAVLVTGATGKQGGAAISALLSRDTKGVFSPILAVTRNPNSDSAKALAATSDRIKLVQGNLDDPEALFTAAEKIAGQPIHAIFSVQVNVGDSASPDTEEAQGKALIDAALAHHVKHFVQTSVDRGGPRSDTNPTNVPHFICKHHIEQYLFEKAKDTDMAWTVLRPTFFMDNYSSGFGALLGACLKIVLHGNRTMQYIATSDIGVFAALALLNPGEYAGKKLSLAGDELTLDELLKVFKETTGEELALAPEEKAQGFMSHSHDMNEMFKWFAADSYGADIAELRKVYPGIKDVKEWLKTESSWAGK